MQWLIFRNAFTGDLSKPKYWCMNRTTRFACLGCFLLLFYSGGNSPKQYKNWFGQMNSTSPGCPIAVNGIDLATVAPTSADGVTMNSNTIPAVEAKKCTGNGRLGIETWKRKLRRIQIYLSQDGHKGKGWLEIWTGWNEGCAKSRGIWPGHLDAAHRMEIRRLAEKRGNRISWNLSVICPIPFWNDPYGSLQRRERTAKI